MSELTEKILQFFSTQDSSNTLELADLYKEDHQKIIGALKSIEAHGQLLLATPVNEKRIELTEEGKLVVEKGKDYYFINNKCLGNLFYVAIHSLRTAFSIQLKLLSYWSTHRIEK